MQLQAFVRAHAGTKGAFDNAMELVSCGSPFPGHQIAIVSPDGRSLGEREVGEIWLHGPSVTAGYFGNPEAIRMNE